MARSTSTSASHSSTPDLARCFACPPPAPCPSPPHHPPLATRLPPPASRHSPPAVGPRPWPLGRLPATLLASPSSRPRTCPRRAVAGGGRQARARNVRPVRHREEHLLLQVRHRRAPPRPAAPRRHYCSAPAALECSLSWEAQHLDWRTHAHARTCTQREREREREREGEEGGRKRETAGSQSREAVEGGESAAEFVPHHPCPLRLLQVRGHPEAELQSEGR